MCKNRKALGLVSMMTPIELMKTLVQNTDLLPKEAAKVVMGLKKHVENIAAPGIEGNQMYPIPPSHRKDPEDNQDEDAEELDELGGGGGPGPIDRHHFPPDPREEPGDYPYDDVFVNYMNNPKRKKPLMTGREPKVRTKRNPLNPNLGAGQPGGDGAGGGGMHRRASGNGAMPGSGGSFTTAGTAGWSSSPAGQEFEIPSKSIKRSQRSNNEGGQANHPPNAGDNDGNPNFMKSTNVGQTIWTPGTGRSGTSNHRMKPYRGYGKR